MRPAFVRPAAVIGALAALMLLSLDSTRARAGISDRDETVVRDLAFAAVRALDLRHFRGRLTVDPHDKDGVDLEIEGPAHLVGSLKAAVVSGRLIVKGPEAQDPEASSVSLSGLIVREGTVVINSQETVGAEDAEKLTLRISVPEGLPIGIDHLVGAAVIGDTKGRVEANLAAGELALGQVADAELELSGSGTISAAKVVGALGVRLTGSGAVRIEDSELSDLSAELTGAGSLWLGGRAERADLALTGAGDLHVEQVAQKPRVHLQGAGNITIGNWR